MGVRVRVGEGVRVGVREEVWVRVQEKVRVRFGEVHTGWGHLLLHGEHLLLLVLVVEHLGAVGQPLVPWLEEAEGT